MMRSGFGFPPSDQTKSVHYSGVSKPLYLHTYRREKEGRRYRRSLPCVMAVTCRRAKQSARGDEVLSRNHREVRWRKGCKAESFLAASDRFLVGRSPEWPMTKVTTHWRDWAKRY